MFQIIKSLLFGISIAIVITSGLFIIRFFIVNPYLLGF